MAHFDVFNGDADGLCALHQLRLAEPREATLVTGTKHDISLIERIDPQPGDTVTVLDLSFDTNREALEPLLAEGIVVEYFDHHHAGDVPPYTNLRAYIDTTANVCTSVLVDRHLGGRFRRWAVVAAWGDNLSETALALARNLGLSDDETQRLRDLGESMNYNAYGDSVDDLLITPVALYDAIRPYVDPLDFLAAAPVVDQLTECRRADLARANEVAPLAALRWGSVHLLPDEPWARRVRGVFANALANEEPTCAHAVLSTRADGSYTVSVRAPRERPIGADRLCRKFPGGNGRVAAAGIDCLDDDSLTAFVDAFAKEFSRA
ncbi:MAG TPA: acetyltransferase [Paraburkholderia sp.]